MKITKRELKKHLFICCNEKKNDECCAHRGSEELVKSLKMKLREEDLWEEYKVSKSGCLGPCSDGITATLYPDNLLLTKIERSDIDKLFDLLVEKDSNR